MLATPWYARRDLLRPARDARRLDFRRMTIIDSDDPSRAAASIALAFAGLDAEALVWGTSWMAVRSWWR